MKKMTELSGRDLKQLSAYLDGELSTIDATRLEARLKIEPHLQDVLDELEQTSRLLSSLPQVRPPRNFLLTREMVGLREKRTLYPVFRFATVVTAIAFAVLVGADAFLMSGMSKMAGEVQVDIIELAAEEAAEMPMEGEALISPTQPAMGEITTEGEADAEPAEAPRAAGILETETYSIDQTEALPPNQAWNEMTPSPESTLVGTEEPVLDKVQATDEAPPPTATQVPIPLPQPTGIPGREFLSGRRGPAVEPIRVVEVGLGVIAVIFAGVTIYLRKQR